MSNVVPSVKPATPDAVCSFCKRSEKKVQKLFGNGMTGGLFKAICSDCVRLAASRLRETVDEPDHR